MIRDCGREYYLAALAYGRHHHDETGEPYWTARSGMPSWVSSRSRGSRGHDDTRKYSTPPAPRFDLEVYPGRWCVGLHGIDHAGLLSTRIVQTKNDLEGFLRHFAKQGRTVVSYNGERFDVPLIRAILKGIDSYAPAQQIIRENPPAGFANAILPEFPCDHIDLWHAWQGWVFSLTQSRGGEPGTADSQGVAFRAGSGAYG